MLIEFFTLLNFLDRCKTARRHGISPSQLFSWRKLAENCALTGITKSKKTIHLNAEANELIQSLHLIPHPEGGYFAPIFKSEDTVQSTNPKRYKGETRSAGTSIYYLLEGSDFSAWHLLDSDEVWHFYKGSAVKVYVINKKGELTIQLLGDPKIYDGASFQIVISSDQWFAAENINKNSFCLVGCTVSPGFEYKDFYLGSREELLKHYPQHKNIIEKFTRVN